MGYEWRYWQEIEGLIPSECPKCHGKIIEFTSSKVVNEDGYLVLDKPGQVAEYNAVSGEDVEIKIFSLNCPNCGEIALDSIETWAKGEE